MEFLTLAGTGTADGAAPPSGPGGRLADPPNPADWDLLGWKYSVISTLATAPFNLVVNFLPARDEREFKAFAAVAEYLSGLD